MKLTTALALFALSLASTAAAQQRPAAAAPATADDPAKKPTPKLLDGHPDLNGYWAIGRGPDTPVNSEFGERNRSSSGATGAMRGRRTRIRISLPTSPS